MGLLRILSDGGIMRSFVVGDRGKVMKFVGEFIIWKWFVRLIF